MPQAVWKSEKVKHGYFFLANLVMTQASCSGRAVLFRVCSPISSGKMFSIRSKTVTKVQILNLALEVRIQYKFPDTALVYYPVYTGRPLELSSKSKESHINKI